MRCVFCGAEKDTNWKTDILLDYEIDQFRVTVCRNCRDHTIKELYARALEEAAEAAGE
ncbi:MAG: hypothetical protein HXS46_01945 [Theionarchaea archaeon]|nr:hypothetical protein [Theionarchaea archaeon]